VLGALNQKFKWESTVASGAFMGSN